MPGLNECRIHPRKIQVDIKKPSRKSGTAYKELHYYLTFLHHHRDQTQL